MKFSWLLAALLCAPALAQADATMPKLEEVQISSEHAPPHPTLLTVEAEIGGGVSLGGGSTGPTVFRVAPFTLTVDLDYAIRYKPWISVYGGIRGEAYQRAGMGGLIGLRIRPMRNSFRIGTAFVAMLWPYTIAGVAASGGVCPKVGRAFHLCADAEVLTYVLGGDLPSGRVAAQFSLMVGGAFDAL